jgi:regulatory protein
MSEKTPIRNILDELVPPVEDDRFSNPVEARKKAMDYLARREHGRMELQTKLTKFGFDANTAEDAISRLVADGLQSEQRFIEAFVRSRINQGKGPARIRADLRARGLDDGLIENGLADAGQNWQTLAREVRIKKFGMDRPANFNEKARQMRFLQSRGFEPDHIQAAVSAGGE